MNDETKTEADRLADARERLMRAALPHVAFDGWTRATMDAAIGDCDLSPDLAASAAPRGAIDLAVAFHRAGDRELKAAPPDFDGLRYSEKVAALVRRRIEIAAAEREAVRRGVTLFSLPIHAAEGARLIWGTADLIWTMLGDTSRDYNWYTKRTILSGVYSSTVLYWLGDEGEGAEATWAFLDRRIEDVMRFEKTKAKLRDNPLARALFAGPKALLERIQAPGETPAGPLTGLPGRKG